MFVLSIKNSGLFQTVLQVLSGIKNLSVRWTFEIAVSLSLNNSSTVDFDQTSFPATTFKMHVLKRVKYTAQAMAIQVVHADMRNKDS
jgi:hypothetical protein